MNFRRLPITGKHISKNDKFIRSHLGHACTWKCSICGQARLDKYISVYTHDISLRYGFEKNTARANIRYCNDNKDCEQKAKNYY